MDVFSLSPSSFNEDPSSSLQFIQDNWEKICYYKSGGVLKEGQLFKYRGMVQDMSNPEYYYSKYQVSDKSSGRKEIRSGKYMDSLSCEENEILNLDCADCESAERRPYLLVPVPGVSEWAQHTDNSNASSEDSVSWEPTETEETAGRDSKRTSDDMEVQVEGCKRLCTGRTRVGESSSLHDTKTLSHPSPLACLVMMYDIADGEIKLNEVLEVVGWMYEARASMEESDEFDDLPAPHSPRLHAVAFRKITNFNPLSTSIDINHASQVHSLRSDLHLVLSQLFFGDPLLPDYLICHLISRIYQRSENDVILGKLSLNISRLPEKYFSQEVYNILRKLLPKVLFLPLSIESLNKTRLLPKKDYSSGHLESGLLQMSDHTHLVIDETQLEEGRLHDIGVKNVNALQALIKHQKIDYDFTYYSLPFPTDIPVLILSRTKSILPSDVEVCLVPDESSSSRLDETLHAVNNFLSQDLLDKLRIYLSIASELPFSLPDHFLPIIQEDFVELREKDSRFSGNDLHELLVIARFMSVSYCQTSLTQDVWNKAKRMQLERRSRLRIY